MWGEGDGEEETAEEFEEHVKKEMKCIYWFKMNIKWKIY